jgi:hypothetical protein
MENGASGVLGLYVLRTAAVESVKDQGVVTTLNQSTVVIIVRGIALILQLVIHNIVMVCLTSRRWDWSLFN